MRRMLERILLLVLALMLPNSAQAFCGFYVGKADSHLYNSASRVVLARKGEQTTVTMEANYRGAPADFALVVPIPTLIRRDQIRVADSKLIDRIDQYSAPRLVEYNDPDPCEAERARLYPAPPSASDESDNIIVTATRRVEKSLGVTIEARYAVGDYDILLLSAKQSGGLVTWLTQNGYRMPQGAAPVIGSYLKQNMKFFVAKINLGRHKAEGGATLRPLQITYASRKFMLPIRLGTVNANGPQELFVFTLTNQGRVETTNYRTAKLPSNLNVPAYTKSVFPAFYKATFAHSVAREGPGTVFLEYAWNAQNCDPCSAPPPTSDELKGLGVNWADAGQDGSVYFTRLHLRYTRDTFPEDLMMQETSDDTRFQGRYVMHHVFTGPIDCADGRAYRNALVDRWDEEARNMAHLTGWTMRQVKGTMRQRGDHPTASLDPDPSWWQSTWSRLALAWRR